ncbi:MAG TPA: glycoside hydrolase family 3 N-terminal domain-containing protein [Pyrinomonadaceae bacterium]|nr:glycoside hydrolase family 3 N-terminal domain-containing protein [Pyrinomonadaceae bacterium]
MRKISLFLLAAICFQTFCLPLQQSFAQEVKTLSATDLPDSHVYLQKAMKNSRPDYSKQIEALLKKMTLEEKVGQMTQLALVMITSGRDQNVKADPEKLEKAIVKYGVGSILNVNNQALTVDKWREIIGEIQKSSAKTRLKIPNIYGIDSIHGANYVRGATLFPQQIGMAATWNPLLMQKASEITAMETRAAAIPWTFSPVLDLGRQPLWARYWETFGEDVYLARVMGAAFVRGIEGNDLKSENHVASSLKHYVGYSMPLTGRDRTPAWIPENYMREYFLPTFETAVKSGARTVMVNSAEINGIPGHVNKYLLTDVLKNEYKFDGFVVSDWEDIKKLVTFWKVAKDEKEATMMAINAGIDMSMVPNDYSFADYTIQLVREKKIPMTRIDDAVRRILRVKYELGLFENPMPSESAKSNFGKPEYAQYSLEAARESLVLLKNQNNILPLPKNKKVLVTGPTADSLISLNNGWTWVWQGSEESLYPNKPTIQKAIEQKLGGKNFEFVQGTKITRAPNTPSNGTPTDIDVEVDVKKAVDEAKDSDVVVLCLGEGSYTETPGNITDLTLPETQLKFAEAIIATGKPVVLVLVEGRPRVFSRIADKVAGVLLALNPSSEGGNAVADVLFGDYNPNGKLPFTYPRNPNNLIMYDHKLFETEETAFGNAANKAQFDFGTGLSYTNFSYSNLKLSSNSVAMNGELSVSVDVKNSGNRAGKESVILFLRDEVATMSPAGKRVKRFAKVSLDAGQTKTLTFKLNKDDLSFVGANGKPMIEAGDFTVMVGGLSEKFTLK